MPLRARLGGDWPPWPRCDSHIQSRETGGEGGLHEAPHMVQALALVAVLAIVATACADDSGGGDGGTGAGEVDCATVEFGCVEVAADEPINARALRGDHGGGRHARSGPVNASSSPLDYLDGTFDQTFGHAPGPPVELTHEDELCSAEGGQAAGTALAADTSIVAVVGTSCSSAALGVADTILSDKGILLFSASNTNPALTGSGAAQPVLRAHRAQRPDPGRDRGRVRARRRPRRHHGGDDRGREPLHPGTRRRVRGELRGRRRHASPASSRSTRRTPTSSRSSRRWPRATPRSCTSRSSWQRAR